MHSITNDRRSFSRHAGGPLAAAGAIAGGLSASLAHLTPHEVVTHTLANIEPAVAAVPGFEVDRTSGNAAFVQAVADKNVELTIDRIRQRSPILRGMVDDGSIGLAGAMYDVHTGHVTFV
jgi:carbonic anhydrase